jgi:hypothetical protein
MKAIVKCKPVEKLSVLDEILTEKITQKSQAQVFRLNKHLRFLNPLRYILKVIVYDRLLSATVICRRIKYTFSLCLVNVK